MILGPFRADRIAQTDREIDQLVDNLYGLDADEIKIIEELVKDWLALQLFFAALRLLVNLLFLAKMLRRKAKKQITQMWLGCGRDQDHRGICHPALKRAPTPTSGAARRSHN